MPTGTVYLICRVSVCLFHPASAELPLKHSSQQKLKCKHSHQNQRWLPQDGLFCNHPQSPIICWLPSIGFTSSFRCSYTKSNNTLWVAPVSIKKQTLSDLPEDRTNGKPTSCIPCLIEIFIFVSFLIYFATSKPNWSIRVLNAGLHCFISSNNTSCLGGEVNLTCTNC